MLISRPRYAKATNNKFALANGGMCRKSLVGLRVAAAVEISRGVSFAEHRPPIYRKRANRHTPDVSDYLRPAT